MTTAFQRVLAEIQEMHDRKQADYGRDEDAFANVRASSEFGVPAWVGCMIRANDKMRRLQSFAQKGVLVNESARDSLVDLAVYAIIGVVLYDEGNAPVLDNGVWRDGKLVEAPERCTVLDLSLRQCTLGFFHSEDHVFDLSLEPVREFLAPDYPTRETKPDPLHTEPGDWGVLESERHDA